jgi:hypothetical protein
MTDAVDTATSQRFRPLLVVAIAIMVAAVTATGIVISRDDDQPPTSVSTDAPAITPGELRSLPAGFDPSTAGSFYHALGTPSEVTLAYLGDRLHRDVATFGADVIALVDDLATMRWAKVDQGGRFEIAGYVLLRRDVDSWGVIAASTDGVDLSGISRVGNQVHGVARTTMQGAFSADVFDLDGKPVPEARFPGGVQGAAYLYATAARGQAPALPIDVVVPDEPVVVRVHVVGGVLFSVSEVRLDRPST